MHKALKHGLQVWLSGLTCTYRPANIAQFFFALDSLVFQEPYAHNLPFSCANFVYFLKKGVVEFESGSVLCDI